MNIGGHGNHHKGDVIENIMFENIDVLEHHEPQPDYRGCMSINAGDNNTVRNVTYRNIRVEPFELGQLFDIRVLFNPKYNPVPVTGWKIFCYDNIVYNGPCDNPSVVAGFDRVQNRQGGDVPECSNQRSAPSPSGVWKYSGRRTCI